MTDGRPILVRTVGGARVHTSTCQHARAAALAGRADRWVWADGRNSAQIARAVTEHDLQPCRSCRPITALARWETVQRAAARATGIPPTTAELLEFERAHPGSGGRKFDEVRRQFGLAPGRYMQLVIAAARSEEGLDAAPVTAHQIDDRVRAGAAERAHRIGRTA